MPFYASRSIKNIIIPNFITSIRSNLQDIFTNNLVLPAGIDLSSCSILQIITNTLIIPDDSNYSGNMYYLYILENLIIGNNCNITSISDSMLKYLSYSKTATTLNLYLLNQCIIKQFVPENITHISDYFLRRNCIVCITIKCKIPPTLQSTSLLRSNMMKGSRIYVPVGTINDYITASGWSEVKEYLYEDTPENRLKNND